MCRQTPSNADSCQFRRACSPSLSDPGVATIDLRGSVATHNDFCSDMTCLVHKSVYRPSVKETFCYIAGRMCHGKSNRQWQANSFVWRVCNSKNHFRKVLCGFADSCYHSAGVAESNAMKFDPCVPDAEKRAPFVGTRTVSSSTQTAAQFQSMLSGADALYFLWSRGLA